MGVLSDADKFRAEVHGIEVPDELKTGPRTRPNNSPSRKGQTGFDPDMVDAVASPPQRSNKPMPEDISEFISGGGKPVKLPSGGPNPMSPDQTTPSDFVAPQQSPAGGQPGEEQGVNPLEVAYEAGVGSSMPARFIRHQVEQLTSEDGEGSSKVAFEGAMMDWASVGGFDAIAAADEAASKWINEGADFSETYANKKDEINANLAEDRISNRAATTWGSIAGGVLPAALTGAVVDKFIPGLTWLGRTALSGVVGGSEAALYSYNSDGTKEEVALDAAFGGAAGLIFGGVAGVAGHKARVLLGKNTTNTEKAAAKELLDAINIKHTANNMPELTPKQMTEMLRERGVEAVMGDYYPDMLPHMKNAMAVRGTEGSDMILDLLRTRNNVEKSFPQAIDDVVAAPRSRSLDEFKRFTADRHKRLNAKYDQVFENLPGGGFKPDGMRKSLATMIEDLPADKVDNRQASKALSSFKEMVDSAVKGKKEQVITPRELHNIKRNFYKANRNNPQAKVIYDQLTDWIGEQAPEYRKLARTYSNAIDQETAYKDGYKYFTAKKANTKDVERKLGSLNTYAEITAFANGARRKISEDLNGKAPQAIIKYFSENAHSIDKLRAVLGKERADKLLGATMAEVAVETTNRALNASRGQMQSATKGSKVKENARNAFVALGAPGRSPGKLNALYKSLFPDDSPGNAANLIGEMSTAPLEQQPAIIQQLESIAKYGNPTTRTMRGAGVGGMAAGATAGAGGAALDINDAVREGAPAILDYLNNAANSE